MFQYKEPLSRFNSQWLNRKYSIYLKLDVLNENICQQLKINVNQNCFQNTEYH